MKAIEVNNNWWLLYIEMSQGKLIVRPYDNKALGEASAVPNKGRVISFEAVAVGKSLFLFTVESQVRDARLYEAGGNRSILLPVVHP